MKNTHRIVKYVVEAHFVTVKTNEGEISHSEVILGELITCNPTPNQTAALEQS